MDFGEQVPLWAPSQDTGGRVIALPYEMVTRWRGPVMPKLELQQTEYMSAISWLLGMRLGIDMISREDHSVRSEKHSTQSHKCSVRLA